MGSMQSNVECGYQLSICSGIKKTTTNLKRVGRCEILAACSSTYSPVRTSQKAHSVSIK
jgi:hypothetical protein